MNQLSSDTISLPTKMSNGNGKATVSSRGFITETLGLGSSKELDSTDPDRMVVLARGWTIRKRGHFEEVVDWMGKVRAQIHDHRSCGGDLYMQPIT